MTMRCTKCGDYRLGYGLKAGVCARCRALEAAKMQGPLCACGAALDDVFLCCQCERQADGDLRAIAEREAFEEHYRNRPSHYRVDSVDWGAIKDSLDHTWIAINDLP